LAGIPPVTFVPFEVQTLASAELIQEFFLTKACLAGSGITPVYPPCGSIAGDPIE